MFSAGPELSLVRNNLKGGSDVVAAVPKLISTHWKELSEDHKDFYCEVASRDWKRYQTELNEYKAVVSGVMVIPSSTHLQNPFQEVVG